MVVYEPFSDIPIIHRQAIYAYYYSQYTDSITVFFFLHHDPQHGYEKSDSLHPPYATQAPKKTNVSASNGTLVSQT